MMTVGLSTVLFAEAGYGLHWIFYVTHMKVLIANMSHNLPLGFNFIASDYNASHMN